ncbi:MAG: PKD domain-containing protein, partial [Bacteroidia bacterium]
MNKKLVPIIFALILPLFSIAQHDHEKNTANKPFDMKTAKSPYLHKFNANLLAGFDEAATMRKVIARTSKPAEQKEYFESLVRQHVAAHTPQMPVGHGKQPFVSSYNAASKTINVNLTPYSGYCPNAGFETMTFGGWTGDTYTNSTGTNWNTFTPAWASGIMTAGNNTPQQANWPAFPTSMYPNRHTIMTIPPTLNNPPNVVGWDSVAIKAVTHVSEIEFVPPTANGATCRLGNANNNFNETERLVYSMTVSPANNQFTYSYAVIIYDGGHLGGEQPFFKITARDQNGNSIGGACGIYQIDATQVATDPTFYAAATYNSWNNTWTDPTVGGFNSYYYKKWSTVGIDLSAYNGQTVTIEFQTGDCTFGGHWCYAYVDASCQPSQITLNYCPGSTVAYAVGPDGYASYQWYGPNTMTPIGGQTNDTLVVNNGNVGDVYTLIAASASGCTSTMQVTLMPTSVNVQNTFSTPSCATGSSGSVTVVPTGSSSGYSYAWSGPAGPITGNTATIQNLAPGTYSVTVSAPGCGFKDTMVTVGITPPIFLSSTQNLCGNPFVVNAPAGSGYTWYDASLNPIPSAQGITPLIVPNNGNTSATVVYTNLQGCRDSMRINVTQQVNYSTQNVTYCGNSATLTVMAGATNITWHDANWPYPAIGNSQTVTINSPIASMWQGYTVAYTNPATGCQDSIQFFLTQITGSAFATNLVNTCVNPAANGSATVNISTGQPSPYTFVTSSSNGYSNTVLNTASTSVPLTGLDAGTYSITVTAGQCSYTGSFNIYTIPVPVTIATSPLCVPTGGTSTVTFTYGAGGSGGNCGAATTPCSSTTLSTVGSNTTQNSQYGWPCPYGNYYSNEKYQILYTAADLNAAGITAGKIADIAFDVSSIPAGMNTTFINYTIKIACTPTTDLGTGWGTPFITAPFVTVWGPQNYICTTGINTHTFSSAYDWDGTSSIIVEICYDWVAPSTWTSNAIMNNTPTTYSSFALFNSDSQPSCPATTMNQTFMERPVTYFNHCLAQSVASDFSYSWNPTVGIQAPGSPTNTNPTVNIVSNNSQFYTLTTTTNVGGCYKTDTFTINVVVPFALSVTGDATVCSNNPVLPLQATTTDPVTGNPITVNGAWSGSNAITNMGNGLGSFNPALAGPGTYNLIYSAGATACGGVSYVQDTVQIVVHPYLPATFTGFGPFCESAPVTILGPQAANPGGTWTVNGATATQFEPAILGPSAAPGHNVTYTIDQGFGCPNTTTQYVMVFDDPIVTFISDITSGCMPSLPVSFTSNVTVPGGTYSWTFGDAGTAATANPIHIYNQAGLYSVS